MGDKRMVISFFGASFFTRDEACYNAVMSILEEKAGESNVEFYLGGKGGFDSFALECCLDYKAKHKNARVYYISPYMSILSLESSGLHAYDDIIIPEPILTSLPKFGYLKRNKWMVEQSDFIIFYVPSHATRSAKALEIAERKKKEFINLA